MRRTILTALMLGTGVTAGYSDDAKPSDSPTAQMVERVMQQFDRDGDGKLNVEELTALFRAREAMGRGQTPGQPPGSPAAIGNRGRGPGAPPRNGPLPPELLRQFDKDGDGKLDEQERASAARVREAIGRLFAGAPPINFDNPPEFIVRRFDKNADGKLTGEELAEAREQVGRFARMAGDARPGAGAMPPEMMKRFDKDGDGQLNDEERAAARAEFARRVGTDQNPLPGAGKSREAKVDQEGLLKRFDKDGDGKLSDEERAAARDVLQKREKP